MAHARQLIRDAVIAKLGIVPGITTIRTRNARPKAQGDLPLLEIGTPSETSSNEAISGDTLTRTATLTLEIYTLATNVSDDTLDAFAESIETILDDEINVAGVDLRLELVNTTIEHETESSQEAALITLSYSVLYDTSVDDPAAIVG